MAVVCSRRVELKNTGHKVTQVTSERGAPMPMPHVYYYYHVLRRLCVPPPLPPLATYHSSRLCRIKSTREGALPAREAMQRNLPALPAGAGSE